MNSLPKGRGGEGTVSREGGWPRSDSATGSEREEKKGGSGFPTSAAARSSKGEEKGQAPSKKTSSGKSWGVILSTERGIFRPAVGKEGGSFWRQGAWEGGLGDKGVSSKAEAYFCHSRDQEGRGDVREEIGRVTPWRGVLSKRGDSRGGFAQCLGLGQGS